MRDPAQEVVEEDTRATAVRTAPPPSVAYRLDRIVWFCTGVVCALVAIRFFLRAFAADPETPFVAFVYGVTAPLAAPFHGIFPGGGARGYVFEPASLVAFFVYLLLGWGVVSLIRALAPRRRTIVS